MTMFKGKCCVLAFRTFSLRKVIFKLMSIALLSISRFASTVNCSQISICVHYSVIS